MDLREKKVSNKCNIEYVVIAICTYKRPYLLKKTLDSISSMNFPEKIKTEILVIDNDKNASAKEIASEYIKKSNIKIHYFIEEKVGLSNVRNRALKEAISLNSTHLAFIDDDEIADKDWLVEHINFYNTEENIFVSSGPTFSKFEKDYPSYIKKNNVFKTVSTKPHGLIRDNCATGNVFFPLNIIKENNICFSQDHNFIGGEDGEFFGRISKSGYPIGWNTKAINYEIVGEERANIRWILKRKYYNGFCAALLKFKDNKKILKRTLYILEKIVTVISNLLLTILSIFFGRSAFFNCICTTTINTGKLIGAITLKPMNYYQKRGETNE